MTLRVAVAVVLLVLGLFVLCVSVLGLFRFRDVLDRLHAGALADTMGLLLTLGGLMVLCGLTAHTGKLLLALVILWGTNPVSAHLIARMELYTGRDMDPEGEREDRDL